MLLVLSYKNHAIDEFLVDLVKAEPDISRNHLIRIGGQCKDNRLVAFSERASYHSDTEVQSARWTVDRLNQLRESVQFTSDHYLASFRSFYHRIFFGEDDDDRRKALIEATQVLMECIIRSQKMQDISDKPQDEKPQTPAETVKAFDFLLVDSVTGKSSTAVENERNSRNGAALVPALAAGATAGRIEHWGDLLEKWLSGRVPLPCCTYSTDCQNLAVSPEVKFCSRHLCYYCEGNDRCTKARRDDTTYFCSKHACEAPGCQHKTFSDYQKYCHRHACWKCVQLGCTAQIAEDEPPRNVCEDHPLCFFPGCIRLCEGSNNYCGDHVDLKCQAITKKKRPCKGTAISALIPFCDNHRHLSHQLDSLPVEEEAEAEKDFQPQEIPPCKARTKKGKPCKGDRMPGSEFCFDHAPPVGVHALQGENTAGSSLVDPPQPSDDESATADGDTIENPSSVTSAAARPKAKVDSAAIREESKAPNDDNIDSSDSTSESGSFATANDVAADPVVTALDIDEMEIDEEEGDNIQHLREVFEVDSGGESEDEMSEKGDQNALGQAERKAANAPLVVGFSDHKDWSWDLSLEERWDASQALMEKLRLQLSNLAAEVKASNSVARHDLQQAKTRAKARVYENKTVIGGTMVGCISRLESIRKTKPFAVVVEEASEVLEPLLFSCLSESTLKLEMIGDHRQLQPSVMSRFEFELCNKVNVSMFQRLIEAPPGADVSSTVLSIQRRMRKNICDLTRAFYADVTEIEDHGTCGTQKIGDRLPQAERSIVATSSSGGREVPGIEPHVFLWTHKGIQGRARVGVSRENAHEATMCCALACYFVDCGVPRPSIVCLTPYKGQLMLLRNLLFKDPRCSSLKLLSRNPQEKNVIRLSTIDRFQGDEEDIVICSLVVDENSRTGFGKYQRNT